MMQFRSNGKILLTGEYAVLGGAKSLALPTRFGQSMQVEQQSFNEPKIFWKSLDKDDNVWFQAEFKLVSKSFRAALNQEDQKDPGKKEIGRRLEQLLNTALDQKPEKFKNRSYSVTMKLEFDRRWGLGSSSTLINNLALWLEVDPYKLLEDSFGGSGYDIGAAKSNFPITYQIVNNKPTVLTASFNPAFSENLFFVYLNRKQNSREAIAHYKNQPDNNIEELTTKISCITEQIILADNLEQFKLLLEAHEILISKAINTPRIKTRLFPDFPGLIKSLGGWGGDFILATGEASERDYFRSKGYDTIFEYRDLIL